MNIENLVEHMEFLNPKALTIDGYDDCIIGICTGIALSNPVFLYDEEKIINKLSECMTEEEASEFYFFNIHGAYMGENTPIFLSHLIP